ncbi:MAG: sulfatase-like hydrolase/transferase [Clostridiales bacterium]|nr:sulfatase-like hydrolase/transferase [Clostridiales bacterium]
MSTQSVKGEPETQPLSGPDSNSQQASFQSRKWPLPILSSLLLGYTLVFFAPVETFLMMDELRFSITDFLWLALGGALAVSGLCFGLALLLPGKTRGFFCALCVGASVALYAQGVFLNIGYGPLDGTAIDWSLFGLYPLWNGLCWAVFLLLPILLYLWKPGQMARALTFVSVLLLLLQTVSLGSLALTSQVAARGETYYLSTQDEFNFSQERNIVVIGLDSFSPDLFAEVWENYPEAFDSWEGFVEFPNSAGMYPTTHYAVKNLFTGFPYLFQKEEPSFTDEAYQNSVFFPALKAEGYEIDFFSIEATSPYCKNLFDNYREASFHVERPLLLLKKLYRLAGFRYAPHAAKRIFWMNTADFAQLKFANQDDMFVRNDATFRQRLNQSGIRVEKENRSFHFFFLWGPHEPFILDSPTTTTYYGNDKVTLHSQTLLALDTVTRLLNAMKEKGIYDDATIVILSDHGYERYDFQPIFLVKKPHAKGPLTQNTSFISQDDFQATVFASAGIPAKAPKGKDVFDVGGELRTFPFFAYPIYEKREYLYEVSLLPSGDLHYEQMGLWYDKVGEHPVETKTVAFSKPYVTRDAEATYPLFHYIDRYHINPREDGSCWLAHPGCTLRVKTEFIPKAGVTVEIELTDVMNGQQRVQIARRDQVFETLWVTNGQRTLTFDVPPACYVDGEIVVDLRFPDATNLYQLNGFQNPHDPYLRQAIALKSITFHPKSN